MPRRIACGFAALVCVLGGCVEASTFERAALGDTHEGNAPPVILAFDAGPPLDPGRTVSIPIETPLPRGGLPEVILHPCRGDCPVECRDGTYCCPSTRRCVEVGCHGCCPESDRGAALRNSTPGSCVECRRDAGPG